MKTYDEINEKIKKGKAVVLTAEEIIPLVEKKGAQEVSREVDVVTTGTFGAMCSSGAFINFGHSDPPIKMHKVWLNDVPVFGGLAAVDAYIGATEPSDSQGIAYGGGHVIEELVAGKPVHLLATARPTDCYPRRRIDTYIDLGAVNQAYLYNPRNAYQNYVAATNSSSRTIYTYMGKLLPSMGNATYSTSGQLSPLINDPRCRAIGVGTRIFLGGGVGYVVWEGTQHNTGREKNEKGIPIGPGATIAVAGDLRGMNARYLRGATFHNYGATLYVGIGTAVPLLDEEMVSSVAIRDEDILVPVFDYSVEKRSRPELARFTFSELRSGSVTIRGKVIKTAPLSSYRMAREIAGTLKSWIKKGDFLLTTPVRPLEESLTAKPLEIRGREA
ncbi:MAG: homocysteine biosynthesis protein [Candidatus Eremiobacteraeota bacterium]|nr:homocysteine biosynthesis protein [Candidatus Eremiobacteraeota bacterium]